jgi:N-hydroxyarylamine O-acetyltransferase
MQDNDAYRLIEDDDHLILERRETDLWKPQYRFTLEPYQYSDFVDMCHYHQTSPESPFTKRRTCTLATPQGRITVTGLRLITTSKGTKSERELADENAWSSALREHFGIELGQQ